MNRETWKNTVNEILQHCKRTTLNDYNKQYAENLFKDGVSPKLAAVAIVHNAKS
jgi:hypothetical protein